ncbi:hypothetical protein M758_4G263300 [Ceratodon purpureus]|nr:hypothetical protein M758_4G263300 [Ceratodon purpureus]
MLCAAIKFTMVAWTTALWEDAGLHLLIRVSTLRTAVTNPSVPVLERAKPPRESCLIHEISKKMQTYLVLENCRQSC